MKLADLFACCLALTAIINTAFGQKQTGYALMQVKNPQKPEENGVEICVNFQANENRLLPEKPFNLVWWDLRFGNTAICQRQPTTAVPRLDQNEILPILYETVPLKFRQQCRLFPQYKYTEDPIRYQIDIATDAGAKALLFFVERGAENINGTHDYLHSQFCNAAVNIRTAENDTFSENFNRTNVFFIYRDTFDKHVVPKLRESPNAELRFRKPAESQFDFSLIVLWLLLLIGVILGSLWSARAAMDRFDGTSSPEGGIEMRSPGEPATGGNADGEEAGRSPLRILCYVLAVIFGIIIYLTVLVKWHALITAILWTLLGIFCLSKCLFALCKYVVFPYRRGEHRVLLNFQNYRLTPLGIFCYLLAAAICLPWFFVRHHPYSFLPLNLINLGILVFFVKYMTFESLHKGYSLKFPVVISTIIFLIGLVCAIWKYFHPLTVECGQMAPVDSQNQQIAALIVPMFNDPTRLCWDPTVQMGYRHSAISLFTILFSSFFVPFWFFIDMVNGKKLYLYGIVATIGFALGWLLFLLLLADLLNINLADDLTPLPLILPFPVWFGTLYSLAQHTTRKLWGGQLQF